MQRSGDMGGYLRVVRTRKWEIALIVLPILAMVIFFTARMTPMYAAESTVLVKGVPTPGSLSGAPQQPDLPTEQALILQSSEIAANVQSSLNLTMTSQQLKKNLSVTVQSATALIHIRYSDPSPSMAAKIANAFAAAYVAFHIAQATSPFQAAISVIQTQIGDVQTTITQLTAQLRATSDLAQRTLLQNQITGLNSQLSGFKQRILDLTATEGLAKTSAIPVQPALIPTHPASPSLTKNIAAGLAGSLVLAVAVVLLRERLDDRLKAPDELRQVLDAPTLAIVPRVREWRISEESRLVIRADPSGPASEAYRTLATNLRYLASEQPLKVVMLTSAVRGEGKTVTSCSLSIALAQSGKRVILVSADLRRPRVHRFFDLKNEVGISMLSHPEFERVSRSQLVVSSGTPNLYVVNSGPVPIDPVAVLGSRALRDFIASLRASADFVIIDVPPVLGVADALVMAQQVDATIVVANEETSGTSILALARDQLETAGAHIVGGIYNNVDQRRHTAYSYQESPYTANGQVEPAANRGIGGLTSSRRGRGRDKSPEQATKERNGAATKLQLWMSRARRFRSASDH